MNGKRRHDSLVESLWNVIGVDIVGFGDDGGFHIAFRHDVVQCKSMMEEEKDVCK